MYQMIKYWSWKSLCCTQLSMRAITQTNFCHIENLDSARGKMIPIRKATKQKYQFYLEWRGQNPLFNSFQHYSTFFRGWPAKTKKISLPTKDNKIAISGHFWAIRTIFKKSGVKIRIFSHFCCLFFPHYGKKVFSTLWKKFFFHTMEKKNFFFHTMEKKDNFSNSSKWPEKWCIIKPQVNIS